MKIWRWSGETASPAVGLLLRDLSQQCGRNLIRNEDGREDAGGQSISIWADGAPENAVAVRVVTDPFPVIEVSAKGGIRSLPFALAIHQRETQPVPRIVIDGSTRSERSTRMLTATLAELARRERQVRIAAVSAPIERGGRLQRLELFESLTPSELQRLLLHSSAVFEPGECSGDVALVAAASGVPVITSAASPPALWGMSSIAAIEGWSSDLFADAIESPPQPEPPASSFATLAARFQELLEGVA